MLPVPGGFKLPTPNVTTTSEKVYKTLIYYYLASSK